MIKITKNIIKEAKNIEFYDNGYVKSIDNADKFLLKFEIITHKRYSTEALHFVLDENYDNNFNFSVYKEYDKPHIITLIIEGNKDNKLGIMGLEIKRED